MTGVPDSIAIALWCVGSIWVVAIIAYLLDVGGEVVFVTFLVGIVAAATEFLARRRTNR
jgi:hypothetical protein